MRGAAGRRVLEAYVIGREVGMRLTEAVEARRRQQGGPTFRGWYRVGVVGPIAAAVTAAKLLDLDAAGVATAIGIAASSAGGLRRNQGTMAKALHAGNAAMDGVQAALLAGRGFSGDPEILEAPLGFFNALCLPGESDTEPLLSRLGKPFDLEEASDIKPFPACSPSHKPVQAILDLRARNGFAVDEIESIEADLHTFSLFRLDPREAIATGFSLPYLLAIALVDGKLGIDQVGESRLHDPQVRALMARVKHNPDCAPESGAERVTVRLRDGRVLGAEAPAVRNLHTTEEVEIKFRDCAGRALAPEAVDHLHALTMRLDELEDIRELTAACGPPAS
jgi:2-methylcitrate dehydratase PrpD